MKTVALIVAGGSGTRMGSEIPKQFLTLNGKPVLMHTLERFEQAGCELVLVLPEHQIDYWQQLCSEFAFQLIHQIVKGGQTRFQSVRNGLAVVANDTLVAIHDGVRPCIDRATIQRTVELAKSKGNAIAAVKLKDSIRFQDEDEGNHSVDRTKYLLIQTPQTFQSNLIKEAYKQSEQSKFTDDASVLESSGLAIHLVEGNYQNIKITTPEDLMIASVFLNLEDVS